MSSTLILLLHGILSRGGVYWVVHPQRSRDIPRAEPDGLLSGLGGCISQYIPPLGNVWVLLYTTVHPLRPKRSPSGFALGSSLGPREISWPCTTVYYCIATTERRTPLKLLIFYSRDLWLGSRLDPGSTQVGPRLDPSWTQVGHKLDPS